MVKFHTAAPSDLGRTTSPRHDRCLRNYTKKSRRSCNDGSPSCRLRAVTNPGRLRICSRRSHRIGQKRRKPLQLGGFYRARWVKLAGMSDPTFTKKCRSWLERLAVRMYWHTFGGLATAAFMVGALSLTKGNSTLDVVPNWAWMIIAGAGFAGMLRYVRWVQSQRSN